MFFENERKEQIFEWSCRTTAEQSHIALIFKMLQQVNEIRPVTEMFAMYQSGYQSL